MQSIFIFHCTREGVSRIMSSTRIVLKSNDSLKYYPNNKASAFTVKTPNLANFGHHLEVALTEIVIPSDFKNVREGYNAIDVRFTIDKAEHKRQLNNQYQVEPDFYTVTSLIDKINTLINKSNANLNWHFFKLAINEDTNQTWMNSTKDVSVKFSCDIAKILGFTSDEWIRLTSKILFCQHYPRAYKHMSSLHVYCNIVEENLVGEFQHQLLRNVNWNLDNKNRANFSVVYKRPFFIPVKHVNLNSIEINILDSANIPVEFSGAEPVIIILEFRNVVGT